MTSILDCISVRAEQETEAVALSATEKSLRLEIENARKTLSDLKSGVPPNQTSDTAVAAPAAASVATPTATEAEDASGAAPISEVTKMETDADDAIKCDDETDNVTMPAAGAGSCAEQS